MKCSLAASILLSVATAAASAAPIYRCGQSYSSIPCPNGKLLDAGDPRTAAQRAEAQRVMAREKRAAAQMERDRRARESATVPALATKVDGQPLPAAPAASVPAKAKKKRAKGKAASSADFTAAVPSRGKGQ